MHPKIEYVEWGLGNRIDDVIELNSKLKECPELHDLVLNHELRHFSGERFVDFDQGWNWKLFWFVLAHPKTWVQFLPFWIRGKTILYDLPLLLLWLFAIGFWTFLAVAIWRLT